MRYSFFFAPTLKEAPKDVVFKSHEYLLRGGYIQQLGSGIYSFLPLGKRVFDKIKAIVKEEMDRAGAQEVMFGFITPASLWEQSGRLHKYGDELLRFHDRKNTEYVLGPTHEEAAVEMIKTFIKSYRQLPLNVYQIHLKFRDEMRPRFGLMRGREFVMKDAYSFHADYDDLMKEFNNMEQCYRKIFTRLGLDFRVVEADSGSIGGSGSKEFMVITPNGEDTLVICSQCDYAANIEAAKRKSSALSKNAPQAQFAKFKTPDITTIEMLCNFFHVDSYFTIKAVVKKGVFENGAVELVFFFIRGCDTLEETKALHVSGATQLLEVSNEEIESIGLFSGFIGPYAIKHITKSDKIFFDIDLRDSKNLICGANEKDYHFVGVNLADFEGIYYCDIASVKEGDLCMCCDGMLEHKKGIEVGHIFPLGQRYSKPLNASFLDENSQSKFFEMGCYGIGISRLLAVSVEQNCDEKGIIWNGNIAPFSIVLIVSNIKDYEQMEQAEYIYGDLLQHGIEVLFDDRNERFGVKMADFELMGIPFALIIGKGILKGCVEFIERKNATKTEVPLSEVIFHVKKHIDCSCSCVSSA